MRVFKVPLKSAGKRTDVFLAEKMPQFTRSALSAVFDRKLVKAKGKNLKASHKLQPAEVVRLDDSLLSANPEPIDLPIMYEDDDVIVITKPEGVLAHSKGALNLESTVASFIAPLLNDPSLVGNRAGIVHRLDRATTGVMLAAKNAAALKFLQRQFSSRKVKKQYIALVIGGLKDPEAIIDLPIERNPTKPQTFRVAGGGKPAKTEYKVLKQFEEQGKQLSLVELRPQTGRTHQLRVHLAYLGHPIVGDRIYGTPAEHMYLHATSLELTLPNGQRKIFTAEPPQHFKQYMGVK